MRNETRDEATVSYHRGSRKSRRQSRQSTEQRADEEGDGRGSPFYPIRSKKLWGERQRGEREKGKGLKEEKKASRKEIN